jgi:hypothetical protein
MSDNFKKVKNAFVGLVKDLPTLSFTRGVTKPAEVFEFLEKMREDAGAHFEFGISHAYDLVNQRYENKKKPELTVILNPAYIGSQEQADDIAVHNVAIKSWATWESKRNDDIPKASSRLKGQLDKTVKVRLKEIKIDVVSEDDLITIVRGIVVALTTPGEENPEENYYWAMMQFYKELSMKGNESLPDYKAKFDASYNTLKNCAAVASKSDKLPDMNTLVSHFVYTLNTVYSDYKKKFRNGEITRPNTVEEAFENATRHVSKIPGDITEESNKYKGAFVTKEKKSFNKKKEKKDKSEKTDKDETKSTDKAFKCYKCNKTGHFIKECPEWKTSAVDKAIEEKSSSRKN